MKQLADYALIETYAEGNFGMMYLASPPERIGVDDELVVVKVLHHRATDYEFRRLSNELRLHAALDSPHIVEVLDAGFGEGVLFYTMRYYRGGTLADPAAQLDADDMLRLVAGAAHGAHAMHEIGIAHRDIKPSSIMIDGNRGLLSDLGLAQIAPGMEASALAPVGTLEFMEPEVAAIGPATRASDVWALGATLHSVLTGHTLYPDLPDSNLLTALRHLRSTPPLVSADLTAPVRPCVERCLALDPADRHLTAEELATELEHLYTAGSKEVPDG